MGLDMNRGMNFFMRGGLLDLRWQLGQ